MVCLKYLFILHDYYLHNVNKYKEKQANEDNDYSTVSDDQ